MSLITCKLVSHLFDGYTFQIYAKDVGSLGEIIGLTISSLYSILDFNNLTGLTKHLDELTFSTQKITFEDVRSGKIIEIKIYEDDYSSSEDD